MTVPGSFDEVYLEGTLDRFRDYVEERLGENAFPTVEDFLAREFGARGFEPKPTRSHLVEANYTLLGDLKEKHPEVYSDWMNAAKSRLESETGARFLPFGEYHPETTRKGGDVILAHDSKLRLKALEDSGANSFAYEWFLTSLPKEVLFQLSTGVVPGELWEMVSANPLGQTYLEQLAKTLRNKKMVAAPLEDPEASPKYRPLMGDPLGYILFSMEKILAGGDAPHDLDQVEEIDAEREQKFLENALEAAASHLMLSGEKPSVFLGVGQAHILGLLKLFSEIKKRREAEGGNYMYEIDVEPFLERVNTLISELGEGELAEELGKIRWMLEKFKAAQSGGGDFDVQQTDLLGDRELKSRLSTKITKGKIGEALELASQLRKRGVELLQVVEGPPGQIHLNSLVTALGNRLLNSVVYGEELPSPSQVEGLLKALGLSEEKAREMLEYEKRYLVRRGGLYEQIADKLLDTGVGEEDLVKSLKSFKDFVGQTLFSEKLAPIIERKIESSAQETVFKELRPPEHAKRILRERIL